MQSLTSILKRSYPTQYLVYVFLLSLIVALIYFAWLDDTTPNTKTIALMTPPFTPSLALTPLITPTPVPTRHYSPPPGEHQGKAKIMQRENGKLITLEQNRHVAHLQEAIMNSNTTAIYWFQNRCNAFWVDGDDSVPVVSIERHGYHHDGFPG